MNDKNGNAWDQLFSEIGEAILVPILIVINDVLQWFSGWINRLLGGK